jgi:hypothetical protein
MISLLVFCGLPDALNELGDQMSELLLAGRRELMPHRWRNLVLVIGRASLLALHAFPPLPA